MATPEQTKAEIVRTVEQFNADVKATREDLTLSPLGRHQRLTSLYESAQARVAKLRSVLDKDTNGDRRDLERKLFGLPRGADASDAVSFRDAQDRVEQVKRPEDLGELMERAATSGDDMLLRAGFGRAWRESNNPLGSDMWARLVDEYLDQTPAARRDAEALTQLVSPAGRTGAFADRTFNMGLSKPQELNRPESTYSDQKPGQPERPQLMTRGA